MVLLEQNGRAKSTKKNRFCIYVGRTRFWWRVLSCPLFTFLNLFFFFNQKQKKKKVWTRTWKQNIGHDPQQILKNYKKIEIQKRRGLYSVVCQSRSGVPTTISPVVKTLTKVLVSSPTRKLLSIGTKCVTNQSRRETCNRRVGIPQTQYGK